MCRYHYKNYKSNFACFDCRVSFKRDRGPDDHSYDDLQDCPNCGERLNHMGRDFKAPRRGDKNQWKKVRLLYEHDIIFDSCGCTGPGPRPTTYAEAKARLRV